MDGVKLLLAGTVLVNKFLLPESFKIIPHPLKVTLSVAPKVPAF